MPRIPIRLTVNGDPYELDIDPRCTLLEALHEELEMRGTSLDCDRGKCGECVVLLDGEPVASWQTNIRTPAKPSAASG